MGTDVYHTELTENDTFVASVVEFALILRDSEYKADSNLDLMYARLAALDLSDDEFKTEFKHLVEKYSANVGQIPPAS